MNEKAPTEVYLLMWGVVSGSASCVKADEGMLVSERCCPPHCAEDQEDTGQHGHHGGHQDLRLL